MTDETGQAETAPDTGQASDAPATTSQPTQTTTAGPAEEAFFDPKELPAELLPAYKQMQAAFTKKSQGFAQSREKIEAYDRFMQNPQETIRQLAQQYGLTQAEAKQELEGTWEPKNWDDVLTQAEMRAEKRILAQLQPVLDEVRATKKNGIEKMLDDSCPDWRQYEDDMAAMLKDHPTLANDPVKLYRMSVPEEVLQSRATQAALKKLKAKVDGNRVSGGSTTTRSEEETPGNMTFQQAVEYAKRKLAEGA